jgi:hypothetical protein
MSSVFGKGMKNGPMASDKGTSIASNDAIGSGSRPGSSKIMIETSQPSDPLTMGRSVPGALK